MRAGTNSGVQRLLPEMKRLNSSCQLPLPVAITLGVELVRTTDGYARDVAEHFLVELETAEDWFRRGIIKEADHAAQLSGQWVTTEEQVLRAKGIDPVLLDAAARARLMEPPVTLAEFAWLLSSRSKTITPGWARKRLRKSGIAWFKMPGSKLMFAHRVDVERALHRATDRAAFLAEFPEERKPSRKLEKPGI